MIIPTPSLYIYNTNLCLLCVLLRNILFLNLNESVKRFLCVQNRTWGTTFQSQHADYAGRRLKNHGIGDSPPLYQIRTVLLFCPFKFGKILLKSGYVTQY